LLARYFLLLCDPVLTLTIQYLTLPNPNPHPNPNPNPILGVIGDGTLPTLHTIWLYGNQIGDSGADAIIRAVVSGALPQLKYLSLDSNRVSHEGKKAGRQACEGISKLKVYL